MKERRCVNVTVQDDEDGAYNIRDPDWLKDLETAAAIAKVHNAVQLSTAYDDAGTKLKTLAC